MTITVSESTPRPLIEEPFVVDVVSNQNPKLHWTKISATQEQIVEEYTIRFLGFGTYEITIEGEYIYA